MEWKDYIRATVPHADEREGLRQWAAGYLRKEQQRKVLVLEGPAASGKTTIANRIKMSRGGTMVCGTTVRHLESRFGLAMIEAADLLHIIDDGSLEGTAAGVLNHIMSGDRIRIERKGYAPIEAMLGCSIIIETAHELGWWMDIPFQRRLVVSTRKMANSPLKPSFTASSEFAEWCQS